MLKDLKDQVSRANRELWAAGLCKLTFGNVSGYLRDQGLMVIKPSGVPYAELTPDQMAVVNPEGQVVEGDLQPSSDTPTHLALYRAWPDVGGVCHTHSPYAAMFAQAGKPLPCLGTTHADFFHGEVPVTQPFSPEEAKENYEKNTGLKILGRFAGLKPLAMPAVLVHGHGPFTWGLTPLQAVEHAIALEECARLALGSLQLNPELKPLPQELLDRHFFRKHGPNASYGQKKK